MPLAVVTGAFSNTGAAVAQELLRRGWSVRTLTNHAPADPGAIGPIGLAPLAFDDADALRRGLAGADAFVNTYWIRHPHAGVTFGHAIEHSRSLIAAAQRAGVARFVQVGVSNSSHDSPLGYFRGKAQVDDAVRGSSMAWAIVRPTLIVGPKDILTNNIAWFLRRFPVFALPAGPGYRVQPILREDAARVIADAVASPGGREIDAAGPDVLSFGDYVRHLSRALGLRRSFRNVAPGAVLAALSAFGALLGDTVLTPEELWGLRDERLVSKAPPLGTSSVLHWLDTYATDFGRTYARDPRLRRASRAPAKFASNGSIL